MEKLTCEICGCKTLVKDNEYFRCAKCGVYYTSEQLKAMRCATTVYNDESISLVNGPRIDIKSALKKVPFKKIARFLPGLLGVAFLLSVAAALLVEGLRDSGVLPDKRNAISSVESAIEQRFADPYDTDEQITLQAIHIEKVEATKFKTRDEDAFGYFSFVERPIPHTDVDGTQYENIQQSYFSKNSDYDPEKDIKWAYTVTGTYDAFHAEFGEIPGEFRCVYVQNVSQNCWYCVELDYHTSLDVLREEVTNYVTSYALLNFEIQPNAKVRITTIESELDISMYYTVYGKIMVKDNYGEDHTIKFTAKYKYNSFSHVFERDSVLIDS